MVYLITGKKGAGKTEYAKRLGAELELSGQKVYYLDGDVFRLENQNNDYSDEGRIKNLMAAASVAAEKERDSDIVLMSFVSPKKEWRDKMRDLWKSSRVIYIPGGTLWEGTSYERPLEEELNTRENEF